MLFSFLALSYPAIDPILIQLGPFAVRWYSLAYIAGILLGWHYVVKLLTRAEAVSGSPVMPRQQLDDLIVWIILGVILGGRIGYVLFYQLGYYLENPGDILQVWQGGMSFHGGFLGVLTAVWLFCRKHRLAYYRIMDLLATATPIGLFFGRLANFINGELYGRVSDVPWAMAFPSGGELPRHPSQLYEAGLEGLMLFAVLSFLAWRTKSLAYPRLISGAFLIGYGGSRMLVELVREPDSQLGYFMGSITMGQMLSLPMVLVGIWLIILARKNPVAGMPS